MCNKVIYPNKIKMIKLVAGKLTFQFSLITQTQCKIDYFGSLVAQAAQYFSCFYHRLNGTVGIIEEWVDINKQVNPRLYPAIVAITSIKPFTLSAGKPTKNAKIPANTAPKNSDGYMCQLQITVNIPEV